MGNKLGSLFIFPPNSPPVPALNPFPPPPPPLVSRLYFVPDYNVSVAEVIIPAAEVSQHISTAGTEASGTSNMKFAMNGCAILGTWDGANIEIAEDVGVDNVFVFGVRAEEINKLREERKNFKTDAR